MNVSRRDFLRTVGLLGSSMVLPRRRLAAAGETRSPLNLLVIMCDQLRADALGCSGNTIIQTPNLDRLAQEGVRFQNACSYCPSCVPARTVILTGHTISSLGVIGNRDIKKPDVPDFPTFDDILARNGYHCEYYGKWHSPLKFAAAYENKIPRTVTLEERAYREHVAKHVPSRALKEGEFEDKRSGQPYWPIPLDGRLRAGADSASADGGGVGDEGGIQGEEYGRLDIPPQYTQTAYTVGKALEALERLDKTRPFSLTCSIGSPHPPMVIPDPYFSMYDWKRMTPPPSLNDPLTDSAYAEKARGMKERKYYQDPRNIQQMMALYYGIITHVDEQIGRILTRLKDLNLDTNTLTVFLSDHGEMLGEHGLHGKAVFHEGSVHVPLILRLPGAISGGAVVSTPVSQLDVFPTLLDYLGMPMPPSPAAGRSLRPLVEGTNDGRIDFCVSEWRDPKHGPMFMIRDERWKYICHVDKAERASHADALYDLKDDPHEMRNCIGKEWASDEYRARAKALRSQLSEWLEGTDHPLKGKLAWDG